MNRRQILKIGGSLSALAAGARTAKADDPYRVGVGRSVDPYAATITAIQACQDWDSLDISGRVVFLKPNLVGWKPVAEAATTHPESVRAVVDLLLDAGAGDILIIEADLAYPGGRWAQAGYDLFSNYHPKVRLLNISYIEQILTPVPGGLAYDAIWLPRAIQHPGSLLISVGKLKTHNEAGATLATKNLFGLPSAGRYLSVFPTGRFAMHDRGVHQATVDINLARPIDFAVVEGVLGMEGQGPLGGTPIRMDTVLAGKNSVAVDWVGVSAMQMPPEHVKHLAYAAQAGLGPASLSEVTILGDALAPKPFALSHQAPRIEYPRVFPAAIHAGQGPALGWLWYDEPCLRSVDIRKLREDTAAVQIIRTLKPYEPRAAGLEVVPWDGRDDDGALVPPGRYAFHVRAVSAAPRPADAVGRVYILES